MVKKFLNIEFRDDDKKTFVLNCQCEPEDLIQSIKILFNEISKNDPSITRMKIGDDGKIYVDKMERSVSRV